MKKNNPVLIGIFGIDGTGKTTQIGKLRGYLFKQGFSVERPVLSSKARQEAHRISWINGRENAYELFDINSLTLLGAFDILQELQTYIWNKAPRRVIIFDKYIQAYKAVAASHGQVNFEQVDLVYNTFPKLDLQFYLKIDVETTSNRVQTREGGLYQNETALQLDNYKREYDRLIETDSNVIHIDAKLPIDVVHSIIVNEFEKRRKEWFDE